MGSRRHALNEIISAQQTLEEKLNEETDDLKRKELILQHIQTFDIEKSFIIPEFSTKLQWLNTSRPLRLCKDFVGKITVLDFFTYCCINCMHILPDLEFIEKEYPPEKGVIVVGVHSAKFENEKSLANVANAVLRHDIKHPVVNDPRGALWSELSITCWPTLLILGPGVQVLFVLVGEGKREMLQLFIDCCITFYSEKKQLSARNLPIQLLASEKRDSSLLFPGKIACCSADGRLAVSDTGHHRILILSPDGFVMNIIGGPDSGFCDGTFEEAKFRSPQGLAWRSPNDLFVADTENHAIRQVSMVSMKVTTLTGNGQQGHDLIGGKQGAEQVISSPWDLCIGEWNSNGVGKDVLLIAMAGVHQIWSYALEESTLLDGTVLPKGICRRMVGSGNEENRNNTYASKASFAQPSGLCIARANSGEARLVVADSESSTIRMVDFKNWAVQGIVGGGRDPMDLFSFGDVDGIGVNAKLQHPLGVCWSSSNKVLYVADTYNHKIKHVDLLTKKCEAYAGTGKVGHSSKSVPVNMARFNEPGGMCFSGDETKLYIADTNNHSIKILDMLNGTVEELPVMFVDIAALSLTDGIEDIPDLPRKEQRNHKPHIIVPLEPIEAAPNAKVLIIVHFLLAPGLKMNSEAPSAWNLQLLREDEPTGLKASGQGDISTMAFECGIQLPSVPSTFDVSHSLELECTLYVCDVKGLCHIRVVAFCAPVVCFSFLANESLSRELLPPFPRKRRVYVSVTILETPSLGRKTHHSAIYHHCVEAS